jgi:glycosyltransferase involved in cell wall biosynthesis
MEEKPMVSIVMITYNHENYIEQAINGVLIQNCDFDIEFIIANDKSTDKTDQIINDIIDQTTIPDHIKLRYYNHPNNKGMISNFVWALNQAKGKYIALCEGDDYWTDALKIQKQVDFLEGNEGYSMCFHRVQLLINEKLEKDTITRKVPQTTSTSDLLKGNFIHTPSVVFRNHFDEENLAFFLKSIQFSPIGDLPLHVYNSQYGKIYQIPESMAVYRLGSGIWSVKKKSERIQSTIRAYICLAAFLKTQSDFDYLYKNIEIYFHQLHKLRQPIKPNEASFKDLSKALMRKVKKKFLS